MLELIMSMKNDLEEILAGDAFVFGETDFIFDTNLGGTTSFGGYYDRTSGLVDSGLFSSIGGYGDAGGFSFGIAAGFGMVKEMSGEAIALDANVYKFLSFTMFTDKNSISPIGFAISFGQGYGSSAVIEYTNTYSFKDLYSTTKKLEYELIYKQYESLFR